MSNTSKPYFKLIKKRMARTITLLIVITSHQAYAATPVANLALSEYMPENKPATYEIVAIRNASDVAAPVSPLNEGDSPIGKTITFSPNGLSMAGLACDQWQAAELNNTVANINDPILADINIAPTDSPISSGDQRIMKSYAYSCEGESFLNVLQVDDRIIVIPWANSSKYLIAEIPLTTDQITQLQKQLESMKFYEGEINGVLDESTLAAVSAWAEYRGNSNDGYRFSRTAITENLLDALRVLDKP